MDYFVKAYKDWKLHSQFQEIVPDMDDEYMFNEKKSIRESGRSLKKYGSTCININNIRNNETLIRHEVEKTDTLQGIALKYGCTTEQIRRANRLFASDSLFLRQFLLIPVEKTSPFCALSESESESTINERTNTIEAINHVFDNYNEHIFNTASPTTTTINNITADNLPSSQQSQQQQQSQQLPARPYSIAGDLLLVNENDDDMSLNKYGNTNSKQSKSLDSVVTITPEEENRRCINEFLNKIDTTISESRKYVERSKEMITSQSDNDLFVATDFVQRRNQNINSSYKQNHQRQSSTGSASDTVHLLNTTQTRRVQNTLKRPHKQQQQQQQDDLNDM